VIEAARYYVAAGIDPEYSKLFVQSHVPEHTELAWYLTTLTPMGELERMTQFKEKSQQQQSVLAGIFTYPVLMAADILLYKATVVPVGEDQVQHLELTREIARKFNNRYTPKRKYPTFPEPQQKLSIAPRIMGLDGQFKMSKSRGNDIGMLESDAEIRKKLKGAFTDPQRVTRDIPGNPDVCNIFTMHKAVSAPELVKTANDNCRSAGWGCGDCKEALGASLSEKLTPIRSKAEVLAKQPDQLWDVLSDGARKCRALAQETMREVRERMGIVPARP
jgi:tryptophanyl-tRNA synthetase